MPSIFLCKENSSHSDAETSPVCTAVHSVSWATFEYVVESNSVGFYSWPDLCAWWNSKKKKGVQSM